MIALQITFWLCFCLLAWTYIGYPLVIGLLAWLFPKPWRKDECTGTVSMIIAAHNEQDVIREKVENCLSLDFGNMDVDIIIVSDGSTDQTNAILEEFADVDPRLKVITYEPRAGKANALNVGFTHSTGQILIFGDANVIVGETSCRKLLEPFADSKVGVVCGRVLIRASGDEEIAGESLYMKYEGAIQRAAARFWTMVGVDGALFAMRRDLFRPLPPNVILDDLVLTTQAPVAGQRIVYETEAVAVEEVVPSVANEQKRKARIVAGGYQFLRSLPRIGLALGPSAWFVLLSHRVLRWCAPFPLILLFLTNMLLLGNVVYRWLFIAQCVFYSLAVVGALVSALRRNYLVYVPYYFTMVNTAAFRGFLRSVTSRQQVLWDKVER
jgi:biofilm PGA synthesis N-glycosyltransferase PgaC